ncbi:hypothetical protein N474_09595 [Pseudoalteromonas luteoviolacea CPMOR-2]|uniref:MotA/TolQ/ExbB proton channel domain-containing protein n=1 Tax=Pseudoalteromonas luteoviolacea DSM 6061 TaxID=1365250 RepID=A0A166VXV9_9GAMM|nr:hypothetical protein [Pseudoalteromonas luteoviolacea]KZN34396.1 hypothetical protein N475_19145 [Pseudoalteromonas luteoviolacea DSM 6061]KZN56864.1 hypothetical protein N474_09595 [Pseudoalteromonas luteoviolacea CPMOR-2]MBE0389888.1 hypothetical protein [Pseudoalteromonas luteoviolacea DSM 6061]
MKKTSTLSHISKLGMWGWWAFPILCFLPMAVLWGNIPDNIRSGNNYQLVFSIAVYVLPLIWAYKQSWRAKKRFNIEFRLLKSVTDKANKQRRSIITQNGKQVLDVTTSERDADYYLGGEGGAAGSETVASLMVQQLVKNASEMRRDSDIASQVFIRKLVPFKTAVQVPQQVALRLGILFTFIGLLIGLEPVASMFQGAGGQREAIGELISGLTIAFGTSIAGLGAALMIQILVTLVDKEYARTTGQLESAWMDLGHVLSFVRLEGDLPANVDRLSDEIERHRENVNVHTRNLIEQVEKLVDEGVEQRQIVAQTHQKLDINKHAIDTLGKAHEAHLQEFQTLTETLKSYEVRLSTSLGEAIEQANKAGRDRNEQLIAQVSASINSLNGSMEQSLSAIRTELSSIQQTGPDPLIETFQGLANKLEESVKNEGQVKALGQLVDEIKILAQNAQHTNKGLESAELKSVLGNLNNTLANMATQASVSGAKSRLGYVSASLIGGVVGCLALLLGMAAIGEPAQNTLSQIHNYMADDPNNKANENGE